MKCPREHIGREDYCSVCTARDYEECPLDGLSPGLSLVSTPAVVVGGAVSEGEDICESCQ